MELHELDDIERESLLAVLAHLAEADEHIDPSEVSEIDAIAEELGIEDVRERMMRARAATPTRAALLARLALVERPEARELVRTVVYDLAQSDGERSGPEQELLAEITRVLRP